MNCVQLRALAVSSAMCGMLGALGAAALHLALEVQPVANISSVGDAIKLARQQRVRASADCSKLA